MPSLYLFFEQPLLLQAVCILAGHVVKEFYKGIVAKGGGRIVVKRFKLTVEYGCRHTAVSKCKYTRAQHIIYITPHIAIDK